MWTRDSVEKMRRTEDEERDEEQRKMTKATL